MMLYAVAKPGAALPPVTGDSQKSPNTALEKPHLNTARARCYGSPMKRINLVIMPDKLAGTPKDESKRPASPITEASAACLRSLSPPTLHRKANDRERAI